MLSKSDCPIPICGGENNPVTGSQSAVVTLASMAAEVGSAMTIS